MTPEEQYKIVYKIYESIHTRGKAMKIYIDISTITTMKFDLNVCMINLLKEMIK